MKRIILTLALGLGLLTTNAQQIDRLAGPRVGVTFLTPGFMSEELETSMITQYGWQWESRFADGGGNITGIVEWIVLVGGMERGKFLPSASSIIGARTDKGLQFGSAFRLY